MRKRILSGVLAGLALVAAACGDDDDSSAAPGTQAPATTAAPTDTAVPTRIVSLSPTGTEMLFAIGAGDQVLAVDDFSNYPEEAAAKMQGLNAFEPNIEAIAGLGPDLVVTDG